MKSLVDRAKSRIKRIEESLTHQPIYSYPNQNFYYVFGFTKSGKRISLGPLMTQQEADGKLAELDDGEVFELKTRDLSKATRIIKAELMSRGEEPDEALKRMLHQRGYEREANR